MKHNVKKIFALVLVVMILCASVSVSADTGNVVQKAVCPYCVSNFTEIVCWGDYSYYTSGPGTHMPWENCTVSFYQATAKEWCPGCHKVIVDLGRHDCYQIHSSCGRGKVWTCIADLQGGDFGSNPYL